MFTVKDKSRCLHPVHPLQIQSNGYLHFGLDEPTEYDPRQLPSTSLPLNLIAGFMRDLNTSEEQLHSGDVYYKSDAEKLMKAFVGKLEWVLALKME